MTESDIELPVMRTDRVRFAETEAQGIVFYGTYFTYLDEAFNAYLREIEYRYDRMHAEGWTTHVAHAAARFEQVIESRLAVVEIGETSLTAAFEARKADVGDLVASGSVVHVAVDYETGEAVDVPETFRDAVRTHRARPSE